MASTYRYQIARSIKRLLLDSEEDVVEIGDADSLKLNVDQVGFYRVHYQGLYDSVWKEDLSAIDRWGIVFDALAFLVSGKMPFNDYMNLVKKYYNEHDYAPALEVSDQLTFLNLIMPSRVAETSRAYHKSQLGILEGIDDAVSSMLRGVMARRLSVVDENYAKELGAKFHDYENVQPDMKEAIAVAYARAYNNFEELIDWYKKSDSDEERIRLLNAMMNLREKSLITRSLDFTLSGQVKKQDVSSAVLASVANPEARDATWLWIKANIGILRKLHEGTANLSRVFLSIIPILGIGRVEEVERFFTENETPEAKKGIEAGLEKLKIYDRLVRNI